MIGLNYLSDVFRTMGDFCKKEFRLFQGFPPQNEQVVETGESESGQQFGREDLTGDRSREKRMRKNKKSWQ